MHSHYYISAIIVCITLFNVVRIDAAAKKRVKSTAVATTTAPPPLKKGPPPAKNAPPPAKAAGPTTATASTTTSTATEDPFEAKSLEGQQKPSNKTATIALYICMSLVIMAIIGITFYIIMRRRAQNAATGAISQDMTDLTGGNTRSREVNQIEETNRLKNLRKQKKSIEEIMMTQTLQKAKRPAATA